MADVQIDLDAVNPLVEEVPQIVETADVVFVPFDDCSTRINQTDKNYVKGRSYKVTRDEARILIEANKGYIKD